MKNNEEIEAVKETLKTTFNKLSKKKFAFSEKPLVPKCW